MDSEVVQSRVHEDDEHQPQNGGSPQQEPHSDHEKKSVLNKVKAKAKKIKDTIKKHGHHVLDHGRESNNEDQSSPDDHDLDEDEKIAEDREVDGAPVDESEDVKSVPPTYEQVENFVKIATPASDQVENLDELGVNSGGTKVMGEEPHREPRVVGASPTTEANQNITTEPAKTSAVEEKPGQYKGNLERPTGLDEDLRTQGSRPEAYTPPSYQTKTTDPTVTVDETEADKSAPPIYEQVEDFVKSAAPESEQVENLDKSGVNSGGTTTVMGEEHHHEPRVAGAYSPTTETNQNIDTESAKTFAEEEKPGHYKAALERPTGLDEDPRTPGSRAEAYAPSTYQTQVTDPTGTGTDEIDITPVEKSFERMNVQDEPKPIPEPQVLHYLAEPRYPSDGSQEQFVPKPDPELYSATKTEQSSSEIHDQNLPELSSETKTQYPAAGINEQLVPEISTATETQYPSGETRDKFAPDTITSTNSYTENPEATGQTFNSTTTTVEEQPSYESVEKPSNLNNFTDKTSSATSAIADKAVSAENVVDSKLGYGEKGDGDNKVPTLEDEKIEGASNKSGFTLEYGKNIANSLTEKLAPVYGKVAGVGSAVKSKVSGTRTGDSVGVEEENVGKEQDKGVSVKGYLAEKLKPGEEDKALSEVISEALYKRKEEPKKASGPEDRDVNKVVSDATQKREEETVEKEHGHLGSGNEKSETVSAESYVSSPGKGVVGKIKGVVGSWFGKSEENQSSQGEDLPRNKNTGVEVEQLSKAEGERRLQE